MCNLASIALNRYVKDKTFDFEQLKYVTKVIVRNLNKIIDVNFYPVEEVKFSICFRATLVTRKTIVFALISRSKIGGSTFTSCHL